MGRNAKLDPDMPVDTIMREWPATVEVFIRHRLLCIGCPIGPFHTVGDACLAHGLAEDALVRELEELIHESAS